MIKCSHASLYKFCCVVALNSTDGYNQRTCGIRLLDRYEDYREFYVYFKTGHRLSVVQLDIDNK